ncbi:eukaryotic translation initiation factor 5A-1/2-like [Camellia sinensis]|uniref:eukaryotic translation initiation factor 5A-1/2-like n=1 Tax=Camellia sinensis TaxID=4442 RepID=UPI0010364BAA|nr:eukaryotic translation initiation factor 5A-1/2-like [Camellia sinensis]
MRFHFDRLSPSSSIYLKLSPDRPRISGPPLSQVSLLTENGNTKDDLRLPTDDALLPTENSSHDWYIPLFYTNMSARAFYEPILVTDFVAKYFNVKDLTRPLSDLDCLKVPS